MDTPPAQQKFRLVFTGECYPGHDPQAVRDAVVAALKLNDRKADRLFSGRRVVLRSGLDLPSAHRYLVRLSAMGAVVHAEPPLSSVVPPSPVDSPPLRRSAAWWRSRSWVAAGAAGALALLLLVAAGQLWPGPDPAPLPVPVPVPPAPEPPPPLAMPSVPDVAPATPPATPAAAPPDPGDAGLPDDMSPEAKRAYVGLYRQAPGHKAFVISASRHHALHTGAVSPELARETALSHCLAALQPGDEPCRVIDEDGQLQE